MYNTNQCCMHTKSTQLQHTVWAYKFSSIFICQYFLIAIFMDSYLTHTLNPLKTGLPILPDLPHTYGNNHNIGFQANLLY